MSASLTQKKHRYSPLHTAGFLAFTISSFSYIGSASIAYLNNAPHSKTLSHDPFTFLIIISLFFIYLDLWAHDEDYSYNESILSKSFAIRCFDFTYRFLSYVTITYFIVKHRFGFTNASNGNLDGAIRHHFIVIAFVLVTTIIWHSFVRSRGESIQCLPNDKFKITPNLKRFQFPYWALLLLGAVYALTPFVLLYGSKVYSFLESIPTPLGTLPPQEPMNDIALAREGFFTIAGMLYATFPILILVIIHLTRKSYWRAVFIHNRCW